MTRFYLPAKNLETWMHQNAAEYTGDFAEGSLLDSFVVWTKNGVAAIYEHFLNAWSSDYLIEFERGDGENVWRRWNDFMERYEAEYGSA